MKQHDILWGCIDCDSPIIDLTGCTHTLYKRLGGNAMLLSIPPRVPITKEAGDRRAPGSDQDTPGPLSGDLPFQAGTAGRKSWRDGL